MEDYTEVEEIIKEYAGEFDLDKIMEKHWNTVDVLELMNGAVKKLTNIHSNKCDNCGVDNVPWSAPIELWLRICKQNEYLCPKCFVDKAQPKLKPNEGIGFKAEIFYK